jgi:hypothetical protein
MPTAERLIERGFLSGNDGLLIFTFLGSLVVKATVDVGLARVLIAIRVVGLRV